MTHILLNIIYFSDCPLFDLTDCKSCHGDGINLECRVTELSSNPMHICTLPVDCYAKEDHSGSVGEVWKIIVTIIVMVFLLSCLFMFALIKCKLICQNTHTDISLDWIHKLR